jgi:ABC-2 type transport system permease protein
MARTMIENKKKIPLKNYIKNAYKYRYLIQEIVRKNIKLQYRNSFLGMFWTFLQPLLTMIILVLVFGSLFGTSSSGVVCYPIYVLCGRLIYECYSQATKRGMRSIRNSASIIKKVYVPKYVYPLSNILANFVTFLISLSVLVVVFLFFFIFKHAKYPTLVLSWKFLLIIVPILLLFLLSMGCGMILSVLNVFFKDIEYIYDVFCMLLFYLTPVFYKVKSLHINGNKAWFVAVLKLNPLYWICDLFRSCVLVNGFQWSWKGFTYTLVFALITIAIGLRFFYKKQDEFILHI